MRERQGDASRRGVGVKNKGLSLREEGDCKRGEKMGSSGDTHTGLLTIPSNLAGVVFVSFHPELC